MRTTEEILQHIKDKHREDFLGVIAQDLIIFLPFQIAKDNGFLKDEATEKSWNEIYMEPTEENIKSKMIDYLPFAFQKATNQRGISASRSIQHFETWLWLIKDDELLAFLNNESNFEPYGLPMLDKVEAKYNSPKPDPKFEKLAEIAFTPDGMKTSDGLTTVLDRREGETDDEFRERIKAVAAENIEVSKNCPECGEEFPPIGTGEAIECAQCGWKMNNT